MRSLDTRRASPEPIPGSEISSQPTSDSIPEKLFEEQTNAKTDLEMATSKLKKSEAREGILQNAIDKNAKLKVKQKENVKFWKRLESTFSSTRALCQSFTITLQQLSGQVRGDDQDMQIFEDKLNASSSVFDILQLQFKGKPVKLQSEEENMEKYEQQLLELESEKEEKEKKFMEKYISTLKLIEEKDSMTKHLEGAVSAEKVRLESLTSCMEEVQHDLRVKEDIWHSWQHSRVTQENLENENHFLESVNIEKLKGCEISLNRLVEKSVELDNHSTEMSAHVIELNSAFDTCYMLVQKEEDLIVKQAQCQFDQLHNHFLQGSAERHIKDEIFWDLESEWKTLLLKKADLEVQIAKLEQIDHLPDISYISGNNKQNLMLTISALESEKQEIQDQLNVTIQAILEEIKVLQKVIARNEKLVDSLEKQSSHLRDTLYEKEQLHLQLIDKEKHLEEQRTEVLASLAVLENTLTEAKKQYLLSKQMELSKHLKETPQRNDQAINEVKRNFELEKLEIMNLEKEKADKLVGEMETTCEQKVAESIEKSRQNLIHVQEEHASLVCTRIDRSSVGHHTMADGTCLDPRWQSFQVGHRPRAFEICFEEIWSRLPDRSLLKLTWVAPVGHKILFQPGFLELHMSHHVCNPPTILLEGYSRRKGYMLTEFRDPTHFRNIPKYRCRSKRVVGITRGKILMVDTRDSKGSNAYILDLDGDRCRMGAIDGAKDKQRSTILKVSMGAGSYCDLALVYDSKNHTYKILKFYRDRNDRWMYSFMDIRNCIWGKACCQGQSSIIHTPALVRNSKVYCQITAAKDVYKILIIDASTEAAIVIPSPHSIDSDSYLTQLQNKLCVCQVQNHEEMVLWVLHEESEWYIHCRIDLTEFHGKLSRFRRNNIRIAQLNDERRIGIITKNAIGLVDTDSWKVDTYHIPCTSSINAWAIDECLIKRLVSNFGNNKEDDEKQDPAKKTEEEEEEAEEEVEVVTHVRSL